MALYSFSVSSATPSTTVTSLSGGANEPKDGPGTIRNFVSVNNTQSVPVTLSFYDTINTTITTSVPEHTTSAAAAVDAYGAFAYGVGGALNASGTPTLSGAAVFNPPGPASTGTGLPADAAAEASDYQSSTGVYYLHKYPGLKTTDTVVALNATTALRPMAVLIVPANSIQYGTPNPIQYISGIAVVSSSSTAVALVIDVD